MTDDAFDLHSYVHGIRLFNQHHFFDAHEVLEDVWRAAPAEQKKFLQGLIQLAVGLHQPNHVMSFVRVPRLCLVDVPDQQTFAWEIRVVAGSLAIFEQEVLGAPGAVLPQTMDIVSCLDISD